MKVYYDKIDDKLLTEEEMNIKVGEMVDIDDFVQELATYDYESIWHMLTDEAKNDIINDCKNYIIDEDFIMRDFK